jgi:hypothetical protein
LLGISIATPAVKILLIKAETSNKCDYRHTHKCVCSVWMSVCIWLLATYSESGIQLDLSNILMNKRSV